MKKNDLAKKNFQPGDLVAYVEDKDPWKSIHILYAQILSSEFYGAVVSRGASYTKIFGKRVENVTQHARVKDGLVVSQVKLDDGKPVIDDWGSRIRARDIEFIVGLDEVGELEKIIADRKAKREEHRQAERERRENIKEEEDAARRELNAVLKGTGLYAPFGQQAVTALAIAEAYHEAQSK